MTTDSSAHTSTYHRARHQPAITAPTPDDNTPHRYPPVGQRFSTRTAPISMIRFAGLGVAMNNAHPGVKSVADYVTESNDHDGIRRVIDTFIRRPLRVRKTRAA